MLRKLWCFGLLSLVTTGAWAVPVMPGDPNWIIQITDNTGLAGAGTGSAQFMVGPATPTVGVGSFNFLPGAGDQGVELRTSLFDGTLLSTIASLSYSTYAASIGATDELPFLTLWIDTDGDLSFDDRIRYEPFYSTDANLGAGNGQAASVLLNTWQTWDLTAANGLFYSDALGGVPGGLFTLAAYASSNPLATIVNPGPGGFRFASGYASPSDIFNTNVDNLTFNGVNFDFEPAAPEIDAPQTPPVAMAVLLLVLAQAGRRRRAALPV